MAGMMVSINGILGPRIRGGQPCKYMFGEFMKHLKMLRDNPKLHKDFFEAYVFEEGAPVHSGNRPKAAIKKASELFY